MGHLMLRHATRPESLLELAHIHFTIDFYVEWELKVVFSRADTLPEWYQIGQQVNFIASAKLELI